MAGTTIERDAGAGRVLLDSVCELTSTLVSDEVMARLCESAAHHLAAEIVSVMTFIDPVTLRIASHLGLPPHVVESTRVRVGDGIAGHVAATGRALLIHDIERDQLFGRRSHPRYGTRSLLSAPIGFRGAVRGVINVSGRSDESTFTERDRDVLEALAAHAGVALRNADQYEHVLARAQTDPLTQLANRGHLFMLLRTELARARRYARPISIVMLDVDYFKRFNDVYGHLAGDRALRGVADVMRRMCRTSDTAGRYGGEEFVLVLPETPIEGGVALAEKLRLEIEATVEVPAGADPLGISAGVVAFPIHGRIPDLLLDAADRQLYRAKSLGRGCVCAPSDGRHG
jgi:diguanylate cyclase (GGDEF)-like protein